jgi:hypothetical protein
MDVKTFFKHYYAPIFLIKSSYDLIEKYKTDLKNDNAGGEFFLVDVIQVGLMLDLAYEHKCFLQEAGKIYTKSPVCLIPFILGTQETLLMAFCQAAGRLYLY